MNGLFQDLRYALRQLRKSPGLTLTAALMLALGVGVNTAIFAVLYQVLLRTLPVRKPSELVILKEFSKYETGHLDIWGGDQEMSFAYPAYQALRDGNHSLEGLAVSTVAPATIVSAQTTDKSLAQHVTGNYFTLLGVQPVLGRLLLPDDDISNAGRDVAVMSESYWRSHFGGNRSILNQQIEINGSPFTIIGVARHEGLMDAARPAVFIPINFQLGSAAARQDFQDPLHRWLNIIGRLRPQVSREQAEAQLNTVWWNWRRDVLKLKNDKIPDKKGWLETHLSLTSGSRGIPLLQGTLGEPLAILEILAFLILVIASANVASLLLAKAVVRSRELAVHAALGGSRRRILQKVASEGLLLGLIGVCLGLLLGSLTLKLLIGIVPSTNTLPAGTLTAQLGWSTIVICAIGGTGICLLFSIAPAILSSRLNLLSALHPQAESAPGSAARLRSLLVAGEISLSLVSLNGAAVFGWSLHQLRNVNPGYDTSRNMLTFRVDASMQGKSDPQVKNEYTEITQAIQRQSGVRSVAYAAEGLIDNSEMGSNLTVSGYTEQGNELTPSQNWITPNFFSTMNIPLIAGRVFTDQDTAGSQKVAIVDEAFVTHYFAGDIEKALRGRFGFGGGDHAKLDHQIVGVIPTIRSTSLAAPPSVPFTYLPYDQTYSATEPDPRNHAASFYINTAGDASALAPTVRTLIHSIDRSLPVTRLQTMEDHLNGVMFETRMASTLSVALGGLALVLSAIGLYGLLAFVVTQRTREIGIRIALGADREHIAGLVVKRLAGLVSAGLVVGVFLAWPGFHLLASHDANLAHTPIWLFSSLALLLLIVMLAAAALPAHRASRVDPMVALRYE
jgi:putative ABC transport system permease protein